MPASGSAHGLGPHVVGQRVVVRRVIPGETGASGGPAMTDVLGVCLSWTDDGCRVRTEDGTTVDIALPEIVTGKPIPARTSVRQRVPVRDAERHALALWPDVERIPLGDWDLRTDPAPVGRLIKRANSCLAFGDPGVDLTEAAAVVRDFYGSRDREPLIQLELDSAHESGLTTLGWSPVPGGDAHFMVTSLAMATRSAGRDTAVELHGEGTQVRVVRLVDRQAIGSARAALDGDWLGIHALGVTPEQRGRGHATAMMAALLAWGAELGATTVWLHVETDNEPALALYAGLGFRIHHTTRYLRFGG